MTAIVPRRFYTLHSLFAPTVDVCSRATKSKFTLICARDFCINYEKHDDKFHTTLFSFSIRVEQYFQLFCPTCITFTRSTSVHPLDHDNLCSEDAHWPKHGLHADGPEQFSAKFKFAPLFEPHRRLSVKDDPCRCYAIVSCFNRRAKSHLPRTERKVIRAQSRSKRR